MIHGLALTPYPTGHPSHGQSYWEGALALTLTGLCKCNALQETVLHETFTPCSVVDECAKRAMLTGRGNDQTVQGTNDDAQISKL